MMVFGGFNTRLCVKGVGFVVWQEFAHSNGQVESFDDCIWGIQHLDQLVVMLEWMCADVSLFVSPIRNFLNDRSLVATEFAYIWTTYVHVYTCCVVRERGRESFDHGTCCWIQHILIMLSEWWIFAVVVKLFVGGRIWKKVKIRIRLIPWLV